MFPPWRRLRVKFKTLYASTLRVVSLTCLQLSQILSLLPTIAANSSATTNNPGSASTHSQSHTTSPAQTHTQSQSPAQPGIYINPTPPAGRPSTYPWPSPTTGYMNTSPGANQLPGLAAGGYSGYGPSSVPSQTSRNDLQGLYELTSPKNAVSMIEPQMSAERGMPVKRPYGEPEHVDEKPRKFPKLPGFRAPVCLRKRVDCTKLVATSLRYIRYHSAIVWTTFSLAL